MLPLIWDVLQQNNITAQYCLQSESDFYVLTLPYNSVRFVELHHFVEYDQLLLQEPYFFPLSINKPEFYHLDDEMAPIVAYFFNMDDSEEIRRHKDDFHSKIRFQAWNFQREMEEYLWKRGGKLLKAVKIVLELAYEVQTTLNENSMKSMNLISPFTFATYNAFKYCLLGKHVLENFEIYTFLNHVDEHNTSQFEFWYALH